MSRPRSDPGRLSITAHLLLLTAASVAVFLAGGPQQANLGAFLVVAAIALLACPPQVRVETTTVAIAGGLVLAAALALLPHAWWPAAEWRQRLLAAGVPLGFAITPVWRETLFWLAVLALTAAVSLFALAHPMRSRGQLLLAGATVAVCGSYAGLALLVRQTGWELFFDANPEDFGFFLNRNHTAAFLVTGCVLALGILVVAVRGRHWVAGAVAAVSLALCLPGLLFYTTSRGGILALVAGTLLWLGGLGRAHWSKRLLISFAAVFLGAVVLFLASPSVVRQRVLGLVGLEKARAPASATPPADGAPAPKAPPTKDGRVLIYEDTLRIVRDFPLTGTGLGTFRYVFPFYRQGLLSETPVVHPESDWLMLTAEAGVPALLLLLAGVGGLLWRVWPLRTHPYWPLRWGLVCAALTAILHGFVDVPAHRTALGWWILVIAALGLQKVEPAPAPAPRWQHGLFLLAGLGGLGLGVLLICAEWSGGRASPPYAATHALPEVIRLRVVGPMSEAVAAARAAIRESPMSGQLYFQLAVTLLEAGADRTEVDAALRTQRLLNPNTPGTTITQGWLWAESDPARTVALWHEALQVQEQLDLRRGDPRPFMPRLYVDLIHRAAPLPEVQRGLLAAAQRRPALVLAWLEGAAPAVVAVEIPTLAGDAAFIASLGDPERRRFLQSWYAHGDRERIVAFVETQSDWRAIAWPLQLRQLVDAKRFEEATRAAGERHRIVLTLPEPGAKSLAAPPIDSRDPADSFHAAWRSGNTIGARRILDEARKATPVPPEIWRLLAAFAVHEAQWPAAWQHLEQYLRASSLEGPL